MAYEEQNLRRGPWLEEEDETLIAIVGILGERHWDALAKRSGLRRSGKSCRLRWMNYLRPNLKHGEISEEEKHIILQLHKQWGNKWAKIARRLPGRTDNEIKNYWRSHLRKKALAECSQGAVNNQQEDLPLPQCDSSKVVPKGSISVGDFMYDNSGSSISSGDSPCALEQLPNMSFANSPFEIRVSDWMPCWSHEQSIGKHEECCSGTYSCLCYPTMWNSEESSVTNGMWDYSSSIWGMD